jgi:hypothetical protein
MNFREKTWEHGDPFGIKPHMDSGIFTLLLTDGNPGLERCVNRKVDHYQTCDHYYLETYLKWFSFKFKT